MLSLVASAVAASPARAMEIGIQDDWALQSGSETFLTTRADPLGARWVRLMVPDARWRMDRQMYVNAARAVKASGRRLIVSLMAMDTKPTADEWSAFAADVSTRIGPVDAWSPMNEPNYTRSHPFTAATCVTVRSLRSGLRQETLPGAAGWKRVRRGSGTHRRVVRRLRDGLVVRFKRARKPRDRRRARWIRVTAEGASLTRVVSTVQERKECSAQTTGAAYRLVWDRVAPILRAADPGAVLVYGDLCPGAQEAFDAAFWAAGPPALPPDVYAMHPYLKYEPDAHTTMVRIARRHGLRAWADEWGLDPDRPASEWTTTLELFERAGVELTVLYDTAGARWDTRMRPDAFAAVVNWLR